MALLFLENNKIIGIYFIYLYAHLGGNPTTFISHLPKKKEIISQVNSNRGENTCSGLSSS